MDWPARYSKQKLKREVNSFAEAVLETTLKTVPRRELVGVYFKGSAHKDWESPIDYVPDLSDVDIHIHVKDMTRVEGLFDTAEKSLSYAADIEKAYLRKVRSPLHVPRLQIRFTNLQEDKKDFVNSPKGTVMTLHGVPYEFGTLDKRSAKERAKRQFVEEHEEFMKKLPARLMYRQGRDLGRLLRDFIWRLSPLGPNVLCYYGVPFDEAWALNRTRIVKRLRQLGEKRLAKDYEEFYACAWKYWLSGETDFAIARKGILAGVRVLRRAEELSKK